MDELTERYFDKIYEDVSREHVKQLNLRTGHANENDTQRQVALIAALLLAVVKLRNFRKALAEKRD